MMEKAMRGIAVIEWGVKVVTIGRKVLVQKNRFPGKRARARAKAKAERNARKQKLREAKQLLRKRRIRKTIRNGKCMGRVAVAVWKRYL